MPQLESQLQKSIFLFRTWGERRHPSLNYSSGGENKLCLPLLWLSLRLPQAAFQGSEPFGWSRLPVCSTGPQGRRSWEKRNWPPVQSRFLPTVLTELLRVFSNFTSIIWSPHCHQLPGLLYSILTILPLSLISAPPTYHLPLQTIWFSILQLEWPSQSPNLIRSTCPGLKPITLKLKTQALNTASRVYNGLSSFGLPSYHTLHFSTL